MRTDTLQLCQNGTNEVILMRQKLFEARKSANLTHEDMAEKLGISRAHYTHIELGSRNPSLEIAMKIAKLLTKSLDEIFLSCDVSICDQSPRVTAAG